MGWVVLMFSTPLAGLAESADHLNVPDGPVILSVSGNIEHSNVGSEAQFDRAMLAELPQHEFETTTPWTEGSSRYSGPLMRDLVALLNPECDAVHVSALNGYEAEIPVSDFKDHDVILAMTKDGEAIPIREYGPLWVLYPFDQDETLLSEKIRFRAVWQVMRINVL
ncbi:molybdopterin-dependent oxidoreductase [Halomonas sp. ISL-60]|uniref:molybdopterin-dependent oxidoreductase n=1 Tax=Halomonas sp. ISL-56 TaxID=2819149 RepID=UPI001BE7C6E1|nr:molybdopterin-dependent oxidoreductase [Halomonas sp. ISL-56]MBT2771816.1 molybdopterin-dependent oxidoreductase [Halomonas sp. ISL-60]MBT2801600.1 molybdopterin-dependent oxidoreductase [Halomonas sp. ISL-56]